MAEKYTVTIHHQEVTHTSGIQIGIGQQEPHVPFVIYTTNSDEKIATAKAERELTNWGVELPYDIPAGRYTTPNRLVQEGIFPYRTDTQSHMKQVKEEHPELSKGVIETDNPHQSLLSSQFLLELLKHKFPSRFPRNT